ncbi:MAG: hypothetical protein Q8M88_14005 [Phenylobacterium sp.]|uniref:hypothetical protein n=1 Tax=Phenylobacterium sp. TaxID=1871053 RepID=UPI002733090E|nr:hypothetical protein [Phenylobacterium sp.]MDP3175541.1 hypothetical protein [Phenylobacterium sp.]
MIERDRTVKFSHTLEAQIGCQLRAGFMLTYFFEDKDPAALNTLRSLYFPIHLATRALKA